MKLNLKQKILLYAFPLITVAIFLTNIYIVHRINIQHSELMEETAELFEKESFSFLLSDKGKVISYSSYDGSAAPLNEEYFFNNADDDLDTKLLEHKEFQFNLSVGDKEHNVLLTPVSGQRNSEFLYLGMVLPGVQGIQSNQKNVAFIWPFIFILLLIGLVLWYIGRRINRRLSIFNDLFSELANGSITSSKKVDIRTNSVWSQMASSVNRFLSHYADKVRFTTEIAKGNIDIDLAEGSEKDQLGQSLLRVRDSLKKANEDAKAREIEEEKRRWANEGIAQFADLLRKNHDNMEDLSYSVISNLVQYLNANQGGLFLLNDNDPDNKIFELKAAYAYNRRKYLNKNIKPGEGLVGNCAIEGKHIYMTDIPDDYIKITSGLGDASPTSLLIIPLKTDEKVEGVMEIASFNKFESYQIDFVEKVAESIASTISSVKINLKTNQLLQKSQQQAEEMSSQEEEMRQNMEEMQATQEELSRKMQENEKMHNQLAQEKALLDALMNNLPDYIYFKDRDSKFIRISKSMLPLFPVDSINEMIGKSDFDFHPEDAAREMYKEEQEIIRTEKGFQDKIQHEVTETGKDQWVSVTKLPLYDQDSNLMGTFGISKDITRFKLLEIEANRIKGNQDDKSAKNNEKQ